MIPNDRLESITRKGDFGDGSTSTDAQHLSGKLAQADSDNAIQNDGSLDIYSCGGRRQRIPTCGTTVLTSGFVRQTAGLSGAGAWSDARYGR